MSEQEYCIKHDYFFHGDPDDCPLCEVDDLKEEITRLRAKPAEVVTPETLEWIKTSEGQIGVGYSNHTESGGFTVIKWMPDDFLAEVEGQEISLPKITPEIAGDYCRTPLIERVASSDKRHPSWSWSQLAVDFACLLKANTHPAPAKVPGESELVHIGYTNGAQVLYCVANKSGSFYPDTENDSCIPVYMLRTHAHRLESTTNGEVTLDLIKHAWKMLKSKGGS